MTKTQYRICKPEDLQPCRVDADEQEITLTLGRKDNKVSIFVNDNTWVTKIRKRWSENLDGWECYGVKDREGNFTGYFFEVNKKALCIRNGKGRDETEIDPEVMELKRENMRKIGKARGRKKTQDI